VSASVRNPSTTNLGGPPSNLLGVPGGEEFGVRIPSEDFFSGDLSMFTMRLVRGSTERLRLLRGGDPRRFRRSGDSLTLSRRGRSSGHALITDDVVLTGLHAGKTAIGFSSGDKL